jgi:hypothetical protein
LERRGYRKTPEAVTELALNAFFVHSANLQNERVQQLEGLVSRVKQADSASNWSQTSGTERSVVGSDSLLQLDIRRQAAKDGDRR